MDIPITIKIKKVKSESYLLYVEIPKNFAIQMEAPNQIDLSSSKGLKIISSDTVFKGPQKFGKPEYFDKIEPMKLNLKGKGELIIDSKIFYCDFNKNVCYPAKFQKKVNIL
jgi:hypothetical protein